MSLLRKLLSRIKCPVSATVRQFYKLEKNMTRSITVFFDGNVLRPESPLDLEPNAHYVVTIQTETNEPMAQSAWDVLETLTGIVEAPTDWASEHDHYLYGTPRRNSVL